MSDIRGSALFSADGLFRHRLDRWWSDLPRLLVCMANPSKAGADENDPTIHNLIRLTRDMQGCGGFTVVNAEDYIATDPANLQRWLSVMERDESQLLRDIRIANRMRILELAQDAYARVVAWGELVSKSLHSDMVLKSLSRLGKEDLYCFGITKSGAPKHPLARGKSRIPDGIGPTIWRKAAEEGRARRDSEAF